MTDFFQNEVVTVSAVWRQQGVFRGKICTLPEGIEFRQIDELSDSVNGTWSPSPVVFTRSWDEIGGYKNLGSDNLQLTEDDNGFLEILDIAFENENVQKQLSDVFTKHGVLFEHAQLEFGGHKDKWHQLDSGKSVVTARVGAIYSQIIDRFVEPGDEVLVAGEAQWMQTTYGRVQPVEGVLAITKEHVIFGDKLLNTSDEMMVDRYVVAEAKKKRILLPNFDRLVFKAKRYNGKWENFEFVATKRTVEEALTKLNSLSSAEYERAHSKKLEKIFGGGTIIYGVFWRDGESPQRAHVQFDSNQQSFVFGDGTTELGTIALEAIKGFRFISNIHNHRKVESKFFQGIGPDVAKCFADGNFHVIQLYKTADENSEGFYIGFNADEDLHKTLTWFLRDRGIAPVWWPAEDTVEEEFARSSHAAYTLESGYRGNRGILRELAPKGDDSRVLSIFPFVLDGGDSGIPRPCIGVVTERNLWIIPHFPGQLVDDPRSTIFIRSVRWSQIADWVNAKPHWGQQTLALLVFEDDTNLTGTLEQALEKKKKFILPMYTWGQMDQTNARRLIVELVKSQGAFDPVNRSSHYFLNRD